MSINRKKVLIISIFVFLITLASFGLGYVTGYEANKAPIVIETK